MRATRVVFATLLLLAGCASTPAPGPSTAPPPAPTSSAVASLLDQARAARASGDLTAAAASVERAMRIDRRSPSLYLELAEIRHAESAYGQAESLALKAVSLASADEVLKSRAWALIARARQAAGDAAGAVDARQRAGDTGTP